MEEVYQYWSEFSSLGNLGGCCRAVCLDPHPALPPGRGKEHGTVARGKASM